MRCGSQARPAARGARQAPCKKTRPIRSPPRCRTSPPRRSASSICTWPARPRSTSSSTTSPNSSSSTARNAPRNSSKASSSPSSRACRKCSARNMPSNNTASPARGYPTGCRTFPRWSMTCASSSRCTLTSSTTAPRNCSCTPAARTSARRPSARGRLTDSARKTRICPDSSSSLPAEKIPTPANPSGARATCRPSIRACNADPRASRCSIWTTPPASRAASAAGRSTHSTGSTRKSPRTSAIPKPSPASPNTRWPTGCRSTPPTPST